MAGETEDAIEVCDQFETAMHDAQSIVGSVISALYGEAEPVDRKDAAHALHVARGRLEVAKERGGALWKIICRERQKENLAQ